MDRALPFIGPVLLFIIWDLAVRLGFIKPIGEPAHGLTKLGRTLLEIGDLPHLVEVEASG